MDAGADFLAASRQEVAEINEPPRPPAPPSVATESSAAALSAAGVGGDPTLVESSTSNAEAEARSSFHPPSSSDSNRTFVDLSEILGEGKTKAQKLAGWTKISGHGVQEEERVYSVLNCGEDSGGGGYADGDGDGDGILQNGASIDHYNSEESGASGEAKVVGREDLTLEGFRASLCKVGKGDTSVCLASDSGNIRYITPEARYGKSQEEVAELWADEIDDANREWRTKKEIMNRSQRMLAELES